MEHKQTADTLAIWGLVNIASPIPLMIFTACWMLLVTACFGFSDESPIATGISMLPIFLHPGSCIAAFVFALRRRSVWKKEALVCMGLSAAATVENILLWMGLAYLASVG